MKIGLSIKYLCAFFVVFAVEAVIAVFVHDRFIRPYGGDMLVVVLIYCFVKAFVRNRLRLLPLMIFVFAASVEVAQYFNFVELLGLRGNPLARVMLGSVFDIRDIVCYLVGCVGLFLFEVVTERAGTRA